jgi:DNA-binding transcriptional LysR family regulator
LARRRSLALEDLAQERWASTTASAYSPWRSLTRAFQERGLPPPRTTLVSESVVLKHRAVASSDLLGVSVRGNVEAAARYLSLKILPVKDLDWMRPVAVVYRRDAYLSPAAKQFVEILKKRAKEIAVEKG